MYQWHCIRSNLRWHSTASIYETDGKKQSYPPQLTGYLVLYFQVYDYYLEATVWLILNYFQNAQPHISIVPLTPIQLLGIAVRCLSEIMLTVENSGTLTHLVYTFSI